MADKRKWNKIERKAIEKLGGKTTPNSGACVGQKADGHINFEWRIEHKGTEKSEFRLSRQLFKKLLLDTIESGGTPMLVVNFVKQKRMVMAIPEYCLEDVSEYPVVDFPFDIEAYDNGYLFTPSGSDDGWVILSEGIAKSLLGLADL